MHILYFLNTSSCSVFTSGIDFISAFCFFYLLYLDPQSAYWIVSHNTDPCGSGSETLGTVPLHRISTRNVEHLILKDL